jgi:hypothetical protein
VTPSPPFLFASFVVTPVNSSSVVPGVNATLVLVLSLFGVFVFGLSGGMAGVRAQLDLFGAILLAVVVGIAGGTIRDVLIGIPPATFRDWRSPPARA